MAKLLAQWRLSWAERLIHWAVMMAPAHHPDSVVIFRAATLVFSRRPTTRGARVR